MNCTSTRLFSSGTLTLMRSFSLLLVLLSLLCICVPLSLGTETKKRALGPPWPVCSSQPPSINISLPFGPQNITNCTVSSIRMSMESASSVLLDVKLLTDQMHVLTWTFPIRKLSDDPHYGCLQADPTAWQTSLLPGTSMTNETVSVAVNLSRGLWEVFLPPMADANFTLAVSSSPLDPESTCNCSSSRAAPAAMVLNGTVTSFFCPTFGLDQSLTLNIPTPQIVNITLFFHSNVSTAICLLYRQDSLGLSWPGSWFVGADTTGVSQSRSLALAAGNYSMNCTLTRTNDFNAPIFFTFETESTSAPCSPPPSPPSISIPASGGNFSVEICALSIWSSGLQFIPNGSCVTVHTDDYQVINFSPSLSSIGIDLIAERTFNDRTIDPVGALVTGNGEAVSARNGSFFLCPSFLTRNASVVFEMVSSPLPSGVSVDLIEPNDTPDTATVISLPFPVTAYSVSPLSDQDYYTFSISVASRIRVIFNTSINTEATGMHFELRNTRDDVVFSRVSADFSLVPGTYFIVVRVFPAFASQTFSPVISFDYVLGIEVLGNLTCPPPVVTKRVSATASLVNISLCPPGAAVTYSFRTPRSPAVSFLNVTLLNATVPSLLFVLSASNTNTSITYFTSSFLPRVPSFLLANSTNYTISISEGANVDFFGAFFQTGYAVLLLEASVNHPSPAVIDPLEPNNVPSQATQLLPQGEGTVTVDASLYPVLDEDWFVLNVTSDSVIQWSFAQRGNPLDVFRPQPLNFGQVDLFQEKIEGNSTTLVPRGFTERDLVPGIYFLRVSLQSSASDPLNPDNSFFNLTQSPYTLQVMLLPPCPCGAAVVETTAPISNSSNSSPSSNSSSSFSSPSVLTSAATDREVIVSLLFLCIIFTVITITLL